MPRVAPPIEKPEFAVNPAPTTLVIREDHITLAQALKAAGLAGSGGQAKHLVRDGLVQVNDVTAHQPGQKLVPGDRFRVDEGDTWSIVKDAPSPREHG